MRQQQSNKTLELAGKVRKSLFWLEGCDVQQTLQRVWESRFEMLETLEVGLEWRMFWGWLGSWYRGSRPWEGGGTEFWEGDWELMHEIEFGNDWI